MDFPNSNIDDVRKKSIEIEPDKFARIDKLSFVSEFCNEADNNQFEALLAELKFNKQFKLDYKLRFNLKLDSRLYANNLEIRLKNNTNAYLLIEYTPNNKQSDNTKRGSFRFELSPQQFEKDTLSKLFFDLEAKSNLGQMLFDLLSKAWITRVDFALDLINTRLNDFFVNLKNSCQSSSLTDSEGFQSIRIGSVNSLYYLACYEKIDKSKLKEIETMEPDKQGKLGLKLNPNSVFLRLEFRYKPKKKDLMLADLNKMPNLINKLCIYQRHIVEQTDFEPYFKQKLLETLSIQISKEFGFEHSYNQGYVTTKKQQRKAYLKKIDRVLERCRDKKLIDSKKIWAKLPEILAKLEILSEPQYWIEKHRIKSKRYLKLKESIENC